VNKDGDYQVLRSNVETERTRVHEARVDLAAKLDELGEHHVRRKEYENAMDSFTEALREKRSVFWNIGNCNVRNLPLCSNTGSRSPRKSKGNQNSDPNSDQASSFSSSLLSGISNGNGNVNASGTGTGTATYDTGNGKSSETDEDASYLEHVRVHDATIDALVQTLRNIGNVHSLRGEQDEAMRYFTEVTTLRAQKLSCEFETACQDADDASVETRSFLSGLGGGNSVFSGGIGHSTKTPSVAADASSASNPETKSALRNKTKTKTTTTGGDENSALMSEINEDVRALDDLFRSISFRQGANSGTVATPKLVSSSEKRKSKSSSRRSKKHKRGRNTNHMSVDTSDEPFHRESTTSNPASACPPSTPANTHASPTSPTSSNPNGNGGEEMFLSAFTLGPPGSSASTLAMEKYRRALDYLHEDHPQLRQHQERMNSFTLRIDLQQTSSASKNSESMDAAETKADLELALDIYRHILQAYREISVSSGSNGDLHVQTTVPLSSSSCSSSQKQSMLSISSTESSSSLSLASSASSTSFRKESKRERRQEVAAHIASVLICTGSVYYRLGNRNEELEAYKRAKNVYCKAFGENHVFVAGTRKNIGMVLAERGQYDLAQQQFEKAMSIYIRQNKERQQQHESLMASTNNDGESSANIDTLGKNELKAANMNRDVASVISCIGNVKNRVGELDAALTKYLQALQIYKSLYELKQRDTTTTTNNNNDSKIANRTSNSLIEALRDVTSTLKVIGMVHAKRGDLDTAMQFFQEAMDLLRSQEGATQNMKSDSSVVAVGDETTRRTDTASEANCSVIRETKASVLTRIASIHLKKGELDEAMSSYREAYDLTVENRGNTTNHPEIAGILHYIGGIYHKRG
jgi:tetratricopeptide (TPR) repeat protein